MGNLTENANLCGLKREDFQTTVNGKKTDLYILRNRKGFEVAITNYGGAICSIMVPDKEGKVGNVIQGHGNIQSVIDSPESTMVPTPCTAVPLASTPASGMLVRWAHALWLCIA